MSNLLGILPVAVFMVLMLVVSMVIRKNQKGDFVSEYFIGGRDLGGFVLAMTTVATYSSVSSFVGGPGQAWSIGFGWVYMAIVQVTAIFLVLGVLGKKIAIVSRKINAVTVIDIIRERYQSDFLANVSAAIIVIFFGATMVAQFVGGAKLFETVTGYSYIFGLVLFGAIVVIYTTIGGFKGVAVTDTLCAIMMIVGMVILLCSILKAGGGFANIMETISTNNPELLEPLSNGNMPYGTYFTQWILVGICTIALPQSVVRCNSYKDSKALHKAMMIGTIVIGIMILLPHVIGVLSHGVLTDTLEAYGGNVDYIIPYAIVQTMNPILAGITIIGPIAATISTISSLLIVSSSAIIKDVYLHMKEQKKEVVPEKKIIRISMIATIGIGALVFIVAVVPPSVIWIINMFAFGGLETAFFWTLVIGMFWKRANLTGAALSMIGGTLSYCVTMTIGFKIMGLHQIIIGIVVSGVLFIVGSFFGKKTDESVIKTFFG